MQSNSCFSFNVFPAEEVIVLTEEYSNLSVRAVDPAPLFCPKRVSTFSMKLNPFSVVNISVTISSFGVFSLTVGGRPVKGDLKEG